MAHLLSRRRALALAAGLLALAGLSESLVRAEDEEPAARSRWWRPSRDPAAAAPVLPRVEPMPPDAALEAVGAVIGEIVILRQDIFDTSRPEEDVALFRAANRFHWKTREPVIERQLLFASGEPYSRRRLQETERYLRSFGFLYDAWVLPVRYHDGQVDVAVITRDVWTLSLGGSFQRSGGENTLSVSLDEANFLGTGRRIDLEYEDNPDRNRYEVRLHDPALFGSRWESRVLLSDNSDGHRRTLDVLRPFFSYDTRWAQSTRLVSDERVSRLYQDGEVFRVFRQEVDSVDLRGGVSTGYGRGTVHRFLAGYTWEEHTFSRSTEDPGPRGNFPRNIDRTLSYPWIGWSVVQDRFVEGHNFDQIVRTEDFNLGTEAVVRLGYSSEQLGAFKNQIIFDARVRSGFSRGPRDLLLVEAGTAGRWGDDGEENVLAQAQLRFYWRNLTRFQLYAALRGEAYFDPDPENQLLLGGDTGLRGYPRNYQSGDRSWLVTLEQRYYSNLYLFKLFYLGGAAFFDVGRAWSSEGRFAGQDRGVLRDVGLGLRLASSRSSEGKMVHLDVAFPLDGDDIDDIQWLVTARESF